MRRYKRFADGKTSARDKILSSTDTVGALAGIPVVAEAVNAFNATKIGRRLLEKTLGVDREAPVPKYYSKSARRRSRSRVGRRRGAEPRRRHARARRRVRDLLRKSQPSRARRGSRRGARSQRVGVALTGRERCCGMPKLELGDLESIEKAKEVNVPELDRWVQQGWDLTAVVPSCVLMFKQELPLMFPDDERVQRVANAFFDPFEYLMSRHREGKLQDRFRELARLDQLPSAVPPARPEHRPEDARRARARAGTKFKR